MNLFSSHKLGALLVAISFSTNASASVDTIGPNGINSAGLGLSGQNIAIGQVESGRPGKPGMDDPLFVNTSTVPTAVFVRDGNATPDSNITEHAVQVAGIMVSSASGMLPSTPIGVAPSADLFASAIDPVGMGDDQLAALTTQHVATRNEGDVRAINMSFGLSLPPGGMLDGDSLLTQFVDWSAFEHDVLYVVSGTELPMGVPVPTDNFNGITVGASEKMNGVYRRVADFLHFLTSDLH